jgi:hypothetical protein
VGPSSLGLEGVVNHDLAPRFYESVANLLMNERAHGTAWMPGPRHALTDTLAETEPDIFAHYLDRTVEETQQWHDAGVQETRLNEEDSEALLKLAYIDGWEDLDWDRILTTSPAAAASPGRLRRPARGTWLRPGPRWRVRVGHRGSSRRACNELQDTPRPNARSVPADSAEEALEALPDTVNDTTDISARLWLPERLPRVPRRHRDPGARPCSSPSPW